MHERFRFTIDWGAKRSRYHEAEVKRLREALSSALGYLSAEVDEQAQRICEQGRRALDAR